MEISSPKIQGNLRQEVLGLVGADFIRNISERDVMGTLFKALFLWLSIIVSLIAGAWLYREHYFFILPLIMIFISTRINALNVQIHEGSHYSLAQNKKWNDLLCNWIFAYPIGYTVDQYRSTHNPHHLHLNTPKDPDLFLYKIEIKNLKFYILQDLLGITAIRRFWQSKGERNGIDGLLRIGIPNLLLLLLLIAVTNFISGFMLYILLWAIPLVCLYPVIIRLRVLAEHYDPGLFARPDNFIARTTTCGPISAYLLGANMEYHFEHHLFPGVPFAGIKLLHKKLKSEHFHENIPRSHNVQTVNRSYFAFLRNILQ